MTALTTLERQHRHRDRIKEKLARLERYEWALEMVEDCLVASLALPTQDARHDSTRKGLRIVREALNDTNV